MKTIDKDLQEAEGRAPNDVFEKVAEVIQKALPHASFSVDYYFQWLKLSLSPSLIYGISPNWTLDRWITWKNHVEVVSSDTALSDTDSTPLTSSTDIEEILRYIYSRVPELGVFNTTYKPRTVYPEGEQQELCL